MCVMHIVLQGEYNNIYIHMCVSVCVYTRNNAYMHIRSYEAGVVGSSN